MQNNLTKPEIKNKIDNLEKYFSKYKNDTSSKKLQDVKQNLDKQEYKIAVVANMSAGKSTFINALFGKEVLPAFHHATTDSAAYIYSKPNIEKKAEIFFSDKRKSITITEDLEKEIKQYAQKDKDCKDNKYKNVEKINLYYPFLNLQTSSNEDFSITFIDTPGPNSTGEDYAQKHKDQTRSVLNSVDMALFVFDYGQLGTNLKSDEQGLWHTIKTRYEKDKNFEVYFLINKIDMSMEDNFKDVKTLDDAKKNWGIHEQKAIDELKQAAKNHGIKEPKIYTIASKFALLDRDNISWDSPLESFQTKFKQIFENTWESEYKKYLGILNLEDNINNYINTEVKNKILKIALDNILTIRNDEYIILQTKIQTLTKPQDEATENVERALNFLNKEAIELEKNMNNDFKRSSEKAIENINDLIDRAIEDELYLKIDEMAKIAIAYAEAIADGNIPSNAKTISIRNYSKINLNEEVILELENSINVEQVLSEMQNYMKSIFEDYRNNYLDVKTDLRNRFTEYEIDISKIFREVKDRLNFELQDALDIDIQNIEMQTVDIDSTLSFDVSIPDSVLDYNHEEYSQTVTKTRMVERSIFNPFRWFGDKYTTEEYQDEEHISRHSLTINPKDLKNAIGQSMSEIIEQFCSKEQDNYKKAIISLKETNSTIFGEFKANKQKEIAKLEDDIKNREKELEVLKKQLEDFNNLTKE
ncbi:dynamin family protein [Aliarcobacter cryaerophilus]|uniref:dynamin family protein n=1 Tax=Aliarcobacter cryaerophilus TaxID=28198 RepID=UPI0021B66525|nr:dynamin family protein [Aliarcobacter cryaerophilus]MCT7531696.1 dynamin family protein [Aliarcobacter cryaerophilus]